MSETQSGLPVVIRAEELDPKFKYEISKIHGAENLMACFQCGTCTADCPISKFSSLYRPRKIARMVQLGLKNRLLSNEALWLCSTCYTCIDHCPQGVEIANIVRALRNLTAKDKELIPLVYKDLALNILKSGYVYEFPKSRLQRREMQGLPPLPKPKIEDVKKIFRITGSSEILERIKTFTKVRS